MAEVTSRIYLHSSLRDATCVLCDLIHEQQYVAPGLFDGDRHLGDLCPRCLAASPAECARQVRERLGASTTEPGKLSPPQTSVVPMAKKPVKAPGPPDAVQLPPTREELLALADSLAAMKAWSVTIDEMQEAEKSILRQRFSGLREEDLRRLVDERYEEFFEDESPVDSTFHERGRRNGDGTF